MYPQELKKNKSYSPNFDPQILLRAMCTHASTYKYVKHQNYIKI